MYGGIITHSDYADYFFFAHTEFFSPFSPTAEPGPRLIYS